MLSFKILLLGLADQVSVAILIFCIVVVCSTEGSVTDAWLPYVTAGIPLRSSRSLLSRNFLCAY